MLGMLGTLGMVGKEVHRIVRILYGNTGNGYIGDGDSVPSAKR